MIHGVNWWTTRRGLLVGAVLVTTVYAALAITRHLLFGSGGDLAIFDQAISAASHFQAPTTAMKQPGFSIFGDHFHPIILTMVPLYWIWDNPIMLLIGQSAAIGAGWYIFARTAQELFPGRLSLLLALGLAVGVGTQGAALYDFHEVALGAPLVAMACRAFVTDHLTASAWWGLLLLTIKEDAGVFTIGVAVALFFRGRRWTAVVLSLAAIGWTVLVIKVVIPFFNPLGEYFYSTGERPALPIWVAQNLVHGFVWPGYGTLTVALMAAAMGFLGWRSPLAWAFVGSLLTRAAIGNLNYVRPFYHYNLLPGIFLAFAALDQVVRHGVPRWRWRERFMAWVAGLTALLGPVLWSFVIVAMDPATGARWAMDQVPNGARVVADVKLVPHLTHRTVVTQLRPPGFLDGIYQPMPDVQWVIVDTQTKTFSGPGWVPAMTDELAQTFDEVASDGRWVIWHRG